MPCSQTLWAYLYFISNISDERRTECSRTAEGNDGIRALSSEVKADCRCGAGTKVGKDSDKHSKGVGRGWTGSALSAALPPMKCRHQKARETDE